MLGGGIAAALAFALLPRKLARVALPSAVALVLLLASVAVFDSIRDHSRATEAQTGAAEPSWIDEEIGTGAEAAFLYGATGDLISEARPRQTEFWNRSIETVYRLGPPEPAPVSEAGATLDRLTGRITPEHPPAKAIRYAVAPTSAVLAGALLARTQRLALYRVDQPVRFATLLEGVYDGWMVNDAAFTNTPRPGVGPAGSGSCLA